MKPFDIPLLKASPSNNIGFNCNFLNAYLKSPDDQQQHIISQLFSVHRLSFFVWIICIEGQTKQMLDCEQITLTAGQAMLIRPNQVHQVLDFDNGNGFFVAWREDFLLKSVDLSNLPSVQPFDQKDIDDLTSFGQLLQSGNAFEELDAKIPFLQSQLTAFLYYLTQKFTQDHPKTPAEKRFLAFMALLEAHFLTQKQVQFYANALNCSPKTLNLACQNKTGESVKTVIEKRVLLESKRLLVHSKSSINAIAAELGFIDGTQFAKFFKKYEGQTANEFRLEYQIT